MKPLMHALAAFWLCSGATLADPSPVVVELYTSQGCSSCPPADDILHQLTRRDDVIALALHVDYWDYIGWKDEFADPANAERQRAYAVVAGRQSVYTPQMIINGETDIVGTRPMRVMDAIKAHQDTPPRVTLDIARNGDTVEIDAQRLAADVGPMVVQMLRYTPERETHITRGENAGKTVVYANVTKDWNVVSEWDGRTPLDLSVAAPGDAPVVVMIQARGLGPILAAAQLR